MNFVIAFVVVLILIGAAAWFVRRFGATNVDAAARGRQPRLAVIDSANVDGRRKLVVIRRDNVEHLLMIGGPTDVVVETNIVRAAATREAAPARNGENGHSTTWPLQPEAAPATVHAVRAERGPRMVDEPAHWQAPPEPAPMPMPMQMTPPPLRAVRPADTLAGLAAEIGRPMPEPPPRPHVHAEPQPAPQPVANAPQPAAMHPDQSLAEMAQRLEAALRRPAAAKVAAAGDAKPAPRQDQRAAAAPKPGGQPASNLEKEMASLLGRPGKT